MRAKALPAFLFLFLCHNANSQEARPDTSFHSTVATWFSAWELVYRDIYGIKQISPVDFVLFDEEYIYSTSDVSIAEGDPVSGPDLLNLPLHWRKKAHEGVLKLPDSSSVPVAMMCFAAEGPPNGSPYFVMPLTDFWVMQGVGNKFLSVKDMVTGVFLHEFSHTQQMQNFGRKINELVEQENYGDDFDDNYIQSIFQADSTFLSYYNKEKAYFDGAVAIESSFDKDLMIKGLKQMEKRRDTFFADETANLSTIEDIFLTMEGFGQYSSYVWLTHQKGGNIDRQTAIEGLRRNRKFWSQDQGLLLFLILEQFSAPEQWATNMFGEKSFYVTELIKQYLPSD